MLGVCPEFLPGLTYGHLDCGQAAPPACLQLLTAAVGLCPAVLVNHLTFSLTGSGSEIEHHRKVRIIEVSL